MAAQLFPDIGKAEIFSESLGLIAGKPAPTVFVVFTILCSHGTCGSWLASDWGDSVGRQTENDLPVWLFSEMTLVLPIR